MKTYVKPEMEMVSAQTESLLINATNIMGNRGQLSKKNSFIFDDDFYDEDEQ